MSDVLKNLFIVPVCSDNYEVTLSTYIMSFLLRRSLKLAAMSTDGQEAKAMKYYFRIDVVV